MLIWGACIPATCLYEGVRKDAAHKGVRRGVRKGQCGTLESASSAEYRENNKTIQISLQIRLSGFRKIEKRTSGT